MCCRKWEPPLKWKSAYTGMKMIPFWKWRFRRCWKKASIRARWCLVMTPSGRMERKWLHRNGMHWQRTAGCSAYWTKAAMEAVKRMAPLAWHFYILPVIPQQMVILNGLWGRNAIRCGWNRESAFSHSKWKPERRKNWKQFWIRRHRSITKNPMRLPSARREPAKKQVRLWPLIIRRFSFLPARGRKAARATRFVCLRRRIKKAKEYFPFLHLG